MNTDVIAPSCFSQHCILILKADRLYADALRQQAAAVLPSVQFTLVHSVKSAEEQLASRSFDVLITGVGFPDGDVLDLLAKLKGEPRPCRRVLVVTGRRDQRLLATLRTLQIDGVFDSTTEGIDQFGRALKIVDSGEPYWSSSLIGCFIRQRAVAECVEKRLTATEQMVFAVLGDGCDDRVAAACLGLKKSTILSLRRKLHRKLCVQQRGDLVRLAVQHGYVRFTPTGVVRPGFNLHG